MDKIIDNLYLCDSEEIIRSLRKQKLPKESVTIQVCEEELELPHPHPTFRINIVDYESSAENKMRLISAINTLRRAYRDYQEQSNSFPLYVFCREGICRSPSVTTGFIMSMGFSFEDAYEFVRSKHPISDIDTVFARMLNDPMTIRQIRSGLD